MRRAWNRIPTRRSMFTQRALRAGRAPRPAELYGSFRNRKEDCISRIALDIAAKPYHFELQLDGPELMRFKVPLGLAAFRLRRRIRNRRMTSQ